jgi:hypothetical protein
VFDVASPDADIVELVIAEIFELGSRAANLPRPLER